MNEQSLRVKIAASLSNIEAVVWDGLACPETKDGNAPIDPFTTHRFLKALEDSGSVGDGTGWRPCHIMAYEENRLIGLSPMYLKMHSQGEYIFDHNWAHAYERAGGRYYPKLQIAVPFTPATGRRFLVAPDRAKVAMQTLVKGAIQFGTQNNLSSLHVTFCTEYERQMAKETQLLERISQQFKWKNKGYADFEDFLSSLSSRKRKNIRKERAKAASFGGTISILTGEEIKPKHWDAFWIFYQDTGARKWGQPYLTRDFFDIVQSTLRNDIALIMAEQNGQYIAGALNFIGRAALYGRYWGCIEHHPFLHFELCYYQAIDFAISRRLGIVEAGAQGDHKLARGYMPSQTYSLHWIAEEGFQNAIASYLKAEANAINEDIEILTSYGPFRRLEMDEQQ